jgi:hypothetical protein
LISFSRRLVSDHGSAVFGIVRVPVDRDHGFRSKMITQSGGTCSRVRSNVITQSGDHDQPGAMV